MAPIETIEIAKMNIREQLEGQVNTLQTYRDKHHIKGKIGTQSLNEMMKDVFGDEYKTQRKFDKGLKKDYWADEQAGGFLRQVGDNIFDTGMMSGDPLVTKLKGLLQPGEFAQSLQKVVRRIEAQYGNIESGRKNGFIELINQANEESKQVEQAFTEDSEGKSKLPWGNFRNIVSKPVSWIRDRKVTKETFKDFAVSAGAGFVVGSVVRVGAGLVLSGATGFVGAAVVGGVSGAVIGAGREYFKQREESKDPQIVIREHWKEIGKAAGVGAVSGAVGGLIGFGVASQIAEVIANVSIPKAEIPIPETVNLEPSGKDFNIVGYEFSDPDPLFGDKSSLKGMAAGEWAKAYMLDKFGINYFDPFNGVSVVDGQEVHHAHLYERLRDVDSFGHDKEVKEIMHTIRDLTLKSMNNDPFVTNPSDPADYLISHSTGREKTTVQIPKVREVIGGLRRFF